MTKQDKELLLKDLCARLPYVVFANYTSEILFRKSVVGRIYLWSDSSGFYIKKTDKYPDNWNYETYTSCEFGTFKPYLRPMSSMTKREIKELVKVQILSKYGKEGEYFGLNNIKSVGNPRFSSLHNEWFCYVTFNSIDGEYTTCFSIGRVTWETTIAEIDLLNKHHVDYRGLIPMGLALPAPEGMYNF